MGTVNRVIFNTAFLYLKMLITMFIALFSTRFVLQALGAEDFGIFSLVSGVVFLLAFINAAMTTSTQRFVSFYLGRDDAKSVRAIFRTSLQLHFGLAILLVLILEIAGTYLFNGFLTIPENRINAAKIIYQLMVGSIFFTICFVPYVACITAHENFGFESIVGVLESFLRLSVAVFLLYSGGDRLILYGVFVAAIMILSNSARAVFSILKYQECKKVKLFIFEKKLIKEMASFACWNLFGALCGIGREQVIAIFLNIFFGVIINAAFGVARQVRNQTSTFALNMLRALNPNIVKSEGKGDRQQMLYLSMLASRFGYYLLAFFAVPLIAEAPFVLSVWLKSVPEYTAIFCRLMLIACLIGQMTIGLQTAVQSVGRIKLYQFVVGSLLLLSLPLSWVVLKLGYDASAVFIISIFIEIIAGISRILFLRKLAKLSIREYTKAVIIQVLVCTLPALISILIIQNFLQSGWFRLFAVLVASSFSFIVSIYFIGMNQEEKAQTFLVINETFKKLKKRANA